MRYLPVLLVIFTVISFAAYLLPMPDARHELGQILLVGFAAAACITLAVGLAGRLA
jgi:hypothetical protein